MAARTTADVFESHLALRRRGATEEDIAENYAEDVVLLTHEGIYRGHEGIHKAAHVLKSFVRDGNYTYLNKHVADDYAYLEWTAKSNGGAPCQGWDAFVIREGRIVAQMVHFRCGS